MPPYEYRQWNPTQLPLYVGLWWWGCNERRFLFTLQCWLNQLAARCGSGDVGVESPKTGLSEGRDGLNWPVIPSQSCCHCATALGFIWPQSLHQPGADADAWHDRLSNPHCLCERWGVSICTGTSPVGLSRASFQAGMCGVATLMKI